MEKITTPNQKLWLRFKRNKPALFGLGCIALAVLLAILGYLITPDKTPNANNQIPQIKTQNPGFSTSILKVHKNQVTDKVSFLEKMLFGQPTPYKWLPIESYQFEDDTLVVNIFEGTSQQYHISDIYYPLKDKNNIQLQGGQLQFETIDNKNLNIPTTELQQKIQATQIVKKSYLLGTDNYGRCILSRLILGVRISLLVGLIAVFISLTIGISLGALAGYFGGRIDDIIMFLINTVWSLPTLLLVFAIVLALGKWIGTIFLAVGLTMWVDVARIVRGQVMGIKKMEYIEAAQGFGFDHIRIIFKHILPNTVGPVMVVAAANFATAILLEAGLSYLGFGIQPPTPSWGTMLNENYGYAIGGKPFLAFVPAFAIMLLVLAFNLVGNGLRDALDVKG